MMSMTATTLRARSTPCDRMATMRSASCSVVPRASSSFASSSQHRVRSRAIARARMFADADSDARQAEAQETFWGKMKMAYRIFFPPSAEDTARQEAKKRLRMILVADRCTMNEDSMDEMKMRIVEVVGQFVDLDEQQSVDVSMETDAELGTMYAVSIPVKRVKAEYDAENDAYMVGAQFVYDDEGIWNDDN